MSANIDLQGSFRCEIRGKKPSRWTLTLITLLAQTQRGIDVESIPC
jgi:hypothetical protein